MGELLQRLRVPLLFAGLLLLSLATMVADHRRPPGRGRDLPVWAAALLELAAPVQRAVTLPVEAAEGVWTRYVALLDLRQENERLRSRVTTLEEENLQFREALIEGGRLARIAELREEFEIPMVPGAVVGESLSPLFRSVMIDRGRAQGVLSGMPAITDQGVVGLVTTTAPHASKAMLLVDRQSAVDGMVQRSRAQGIVRGRGSDELEFQFAVRGEDVAVGDVVITSGLGGVYPKGLRLGEVVEVAAEGRLVQTARVRPAVDFGRLEQVYVMLWRSPTMELLYRDEEEGPSPAASPARSAR